MSNDNHLGAPLVSRRGLMVGGIGVASAAAGYLVCRSVDRERSSAADVANGEFRRQAAAIRAAPARQTVEEVVALRKKYQDPIFGRARVWEMIEKLGMCVDASDDSLMCTSGRVDELRTYCNAKDLAHLDGCLARFQPFDMCRKSYRHLPRVDMAKYRALIEDMFPQPILF
jgi:hypothetical protein